YFFFLRPAILVPVWSFLLAGVFTASQVHQTQKNFPFFTLLSFTFLMSAIYVLNQIFDAKTDEANDKNFFLHKKIITTKEAFFEFWILVLLAFAVAFFKTNLTNLILLKISFLLGIIYSCPPFKWKAKPFLDFFANSFGYGILAFAIGWNSLIEIQFSDFIYTIPSFFCAGAVFLNTTVLDFEGDKATNQNTTAVFSGKERVLFLALVSLVFGILSGFFLKEFIAFGMGVCSIFFFAKAFSEKTRQRTYQSVIVGTLIYAVIVGTLFLYFGLFLICLVFFSKWYYKKRLDLDYPNFSDKRT
ncbi:UbiA family prenyltransferase, partial [bacterium]|nr:UbiA family prenyltransferase [bacterium]